MFEKNATNERNATKQGETNRENVAVPSSKMTVGEFNLLFILIHAKKPNTTLTIIKFEFKPFMTKNKTF